MNIPTTPTDPEYLRQQQYADGKRLKARFELHRRFSTNPYGWMRWVFDQIELPLTSRILELGCGNADLWIDNLERLPGDWHITLSDFSSGMAWQAYNRLASSEILFSFAVVDAQDIPFPTASLDGIIANHMLYHVPDRPRALKEIHRCLKPGGKLFATTVGKNHLRELFQLQDRLFPGLSQTIQQKMGMNSFTLENGMDQLSGWSTQINSIVYDDCLEVTQAEPLIDYMLSSITQDILKVNSGDIAALRTLVDAEIAQKGSFHVTKMSGMFIASKD